jgi:histidinol-phosphate aminotransferase
MNLPEKLNGFKPYPAMSGAPSVRIDGNESCFPVPEIADGIAKALCGVDFHRYPDPYATEVCALAEDFWDAPKGSAVAGNGSDELISVLLNALLPRGGKLLICDPDFSMYRFYAALNELEIITLERFSGVPNIDGIIQKGRGADAVILSNPCNPTGGALPPGDVLRVVRALDCPILLDEAYMDFWEGGKHSMLTYIEQYEHLLVLKTCSKNFAMAGIRLGFAFAGERLRTVLRSVKSPYNVNVLTQIAGAAVLRRPDWLRENTKRLCAAKDRLYARLSEWAKGREGCTVTDTAANFVTLSLPDAEELYAHLQSKNIAVRYVSGIIRISAGTDEEHDALTGVLNEYKEVTP